MRQPATAMALVALATLAGSVWASGCTGLVNDCELNLNCPSSAPPAPPPSCEGLYFSPTCDSCLKSACCQELSDCEDNNACMGLCAFGFLPLPPECSQGKTKESFDSLAQCMQGKCPTECAPTDRCNPVTNNGCYADDGEGCELVFPGTFVCVPAGSPAQVCEACDILAGPYCGPGLRCFGEPSKCARYCCDDMDCGTGRCELDQVKAFGGPLAIDADKIGVCVDMAASPAAACDAPAMPPSNGLCFGGFAPM